MKSQIEILIEKWDEKLKIRQQKIDKLSAKIKIKKKSLSVMLISIVFFSSCAIHGRIGIIGSNHEYKLRAEVVKEGFIHDHILWQKECDFQYPMDSTILAWTVEMKKQTIIQRNKN